MLYFVVFLGRGGSLGMFDLCDCLVGLICLIDCRRTSPCLDDMNGKVNKGSHFSLGLKENFAGHIRRFVPPGVISVFVGNCQWVPPGLHFVVDVECRT